jgi:hypothetical protein
VEVGVSCTFQGLGPSEADRISMVTYEGDENPSCLWITFFFSPLLVEHASIIFSMKDMY